jgi:hypothetical protein
MVAWTTEAGKVLRRSNALHHSQSTGLVKRPKHSIEAILSKMSFTRIHWDLSYRFLSTHTMSGLKICLKVYILLRLFRDIVLEAILLISFLHILSKFWDMKS